MPSRRRYLWRTDSKWPTSKQFSHSTSASGLSGELPRSWDCTGTPSPGMSSSMRPKQNRPAPQRALRVQNRPPRQQAPPQQTGHPRGAPIGSATAPAQKSQQASLCEPWRQIILDKLDAGLTAQRIYQDLGPGERTRLRRQGPQCPPFCPAPGPGPAAPFSPPGVRPRRRGGGGLRHRRGHSASQRQAAAHSCLSYGVKPLAQRLQRGRVPADSRANEPRHSRYIGRLVRSVSHHYNNHVSSTRLKTCLERVRHSLAKPQYVGCEATNLRRQGRRQLEFPCASGVGRLVQSLRGLARAGAPALQALPFDFYGHFWPIELVRRMAFASVSP